MRDRSNSYKFESVGGLRASNLLEYLTQGGTDEKTIHILAQDILDYVRARRDCADFRAAYLLRVIYSFSGVIGEGMTAEIADELLSFPYEDCGGHSMCTWTENHRLYAAGTEYLLALRYPGGKFADEKPADYHREHGRKSLITGLSHMIKYGFSEWCSNNYYSETMAGLANLVQFAQDPDIKDLAKEALYMLVYDILSQTVYNDGYMYNPACARAYVDNKVSALHGNYMEVQIKAMRGEKTSLYKEKEACMFLLLQAKDESGKPLFEIPKKWLELPDKKGREICLRQGIDIDDYGKEGFKEYSPENVRYAFVSGAISDYRVISNNMRYLRETGLIDNGMLKSLKPFAKPVLYRSGLLKTLKRFVYVGFDGVSMEEGRIYTYADGNYSISAAFDYRVGQVLYQQNSLSLNLSHKVSLFANTPFSESDKTGSPCYWIGSGAAGRAAAYKNFGVIIFDACHARLGLKKSHAYFPVGLFDEVDLSGILKGVLLGRTSGVNVCLRTNPGVYFRAFEDSRKNDLAVYQDEKIPGDYYDNEYDLMNETKGFHFYAYEVDNTLSFAGFKKLMEERTLEFSAENGTLEYSLNKIKFGFSGKFTVEGREFRPDFRRPADIVREELAKEAAL